MTECPLLTIVVPCFNEAEILPETARRLGVLLDDLINHGRVAPGSCACFVDDGSTDGTWDLIEAVQRQTGLIRGIRLSRNRGHQIALMAGLLTATGDVVISVDADLQDDLNAMHAMLREWSAGAEIVYGVRSTRRSDAWAKRVSAHLFYRVLQRLDVEIVFDHADFRLLSRRAIEALRGYEESNLFLRALIPQLGFKTAVVTYERAQRFAGTSKYPLGRMLALAVDGITSFSTRPLRLITSLGLGMSLFSVGLTAWAFTMWLGFSATVPGWASTVIPIYLVCGIQLLSLGVIGEYVGKIYLETKRRPRFHVADTLPPLPAQAGRTSPNPARTATLPSDPPNFETRIDVQAIHGRIMVAEAS